MRIVIADDEKLARENLKIMLEECDEQIEILGEAENGEELVELALKYHPDIVFADIRMPKFDGLKAIGYVVNKLPETQWIILTGFSEFQYAKRAIELGVTNYLLKPVKPDELRETLFKLNERSKNNLDSRNTKFQNDLIDMYLEKKNLNTCTGFEKVYFTGIMLNIDTHFSDDLLRERQSAFLEAVGNSISSVMSYNTEFAILPIDSSLTAVIFAYDIDSDGNYKDFKDRFSLKIKQNILGSNDDDFIITSVKFDDYCKFSLMLDDISELQSILSCRVAIKIGEMYSVSDLKESSKDESINDLSNILVQIKMYYSRNDYLNFMKKTNDFEGVFWSFHDKNNLLKSNIAKFLNVTMQCGIKSDDDLKQWHTKLNARGEYLLTVSSKDPHSNSDVIVQIKNFIDKNYMKDIGIAEISDKLQLTPNYLSSLFHKKTGVTFKKYLTNTRMLKAKQLLSKNYKVQQVAEEVGYFSTRYFAKLFKSYYNYYPSDPTINHDDKQEVDTVEKN